MDSIDAQCLIFGLFDGKEEQAPNQWQHLPDGMLVCRFGESPNNFSWPAPDVADMAKRWRDSGDPVPAAIESLVRRHLAFLDVIEDGDLGPPDRVIHDLRTDEVAVYWDEPKVVAIIDPEEPGESDQINQIESEAWQG